MSVGVEDQIGTTRIRGGTSSRASGCDARRLLELGELGARELRGTEEVDAWSIDGDPGCGLAHEAELPRANGEGSFGSRAGGIVGHNPVAVAAVILGGSAAALAGTAGVALGSTLDAEHPVIGHDTEVPVVVANNVLFGAGSYDTSGVTLASPLETRILAGQPLAIGDRGEEVGELQRRLTGIGITAADTSVYDAGTDAAVRRFQNLYGVRPAGAFGPTSYETLSAAERVTEPGRRGVGTVYRGGQAVGEIELVYITGKPISLETANALRPMFVAASRAPRPVTLEVVSGYRTLDEQRVLYDDYRHGRGNLAARPGFSNHHRGTTVDLNSSDPGVYSWLKKNARTYGFVRTVPSEPWHWEYRPDLTRR